MAGYEGAFTIDRLRAAYAAGVTPVDVIAAVLARCGEAADNPIWIHRVPTPRLERRAAALSAIPPGTAREALPLYGIPFAVKDNIDVFGCPTTAACPAYAYEPSADAHVVGRLLDAGAICVGKTNLDQFATGLVGTRSPYGACRNPFDERYVSGGSSAGSAVAVALEQVSFALGTDTAGSGRVPAAFNNIVGLKPTPGLLSTSGVVPACRSLDCISVFALDCADALEVLAVAEGFDPADPWSRRRDPAAAGTALLRVGVPRASQLEFFGDAGYAALFEAAIRRVGEIAGGTRDFDLIPFLEVQRLLYEGPWLAEREAAVGQFVSAHPEAVHPVTRTVLSGGRSYSAVDLFEGQYRLAALRRRTDAVWAGLDVLMVPGAPTIPRIADVEAEPIRRNAELGIYTNFVNLLGLSAITVPAGLRADGLPFGVTLIGPPFCEARLAGLAAALHAASGVAAGFRRQAHPRAPSIAAAPDPPEIHVAVVGAHLAGLPLNGQITGRGGRLVACTRTAPEYRLHVLAGFDPPRPGLERRPGDPAATAIECEVWALPVAAFGTFVAEIPPPLGIGTVRLADGREVKGFICEPWAVAGAHDISGWGGWRNWLQSRGAAAPASVRK